MSASSNHWYVQTDFGALLGPMPEDALFEMARTGALLGRDRVRDGSDGAWHPAESILGLFDASNAMTTNKDFSSAPPSTSTFADMFNARFDHRSSPPKTLGASTPSMPDVTVDSADVAVAEQLKIVELFVEPDASSLATAVEFEISLSTPERPHPHDPVASAPVLACAAPQTILRMASTPRLQGVNPRHGRVWITVSAVIVLPLLLLAAWWFWPSQRRDLSINYVAIFHEWVQRRENIQDKSGWSEFVGRSKAQLDQSIPWLEQNAAPGRLDLSLLLYVGRDLQEVLNQPQSSKTAHQKRLNYFVEQLQEKYKMSKNAE
ncbi:MAG: hypothetical protein NT013_24885 [Planctomycetia bacterium]|nr:hypothetical protein [Planctomycetia bacterium]